MSKRVRCVIVIRKLQCLALVTNTLFLLFIICKAFIPALSELLSHRCSKANNSNDTHNIGHNHHICLDIFKIDSLHLLILFLSSSLSLIVLFSRLNLSVFISNLRILFLLVIELSSLIFILIIVLDCVLVLRRVADRILQLAHQLILLDVELDSYVLHKDQGSDCLHHDYEGHQVGEEDTQGAGQHLRSLVFS